jgi:hypothetical protein
MSIQQAYPFDLLSDRYSRPSAATCWTRAASPPACSATKRPAAAMPPTTTSKTPSRSPWPSAPRCCSPASPAPARPRPPTGWPRPAPASCSRCSCAATTAPRTCSIASTPSPICTRPMSRARPPPAQVGPRQARPRPLHRPGPALAGLPPRRPRVVLIDEIDKAHRDFPNDLLNVLDKHEFQCRETGEWIRRGAGPPPIVVVTSNRESRLPEPFLRRCIFHHIELTMDLVDRAVRAHTNSGFPHLADELRGAPSRASGSCAMTTTCASPRPPPSCWSGSSCSPPGPTSSRPTSRPPRASCRPCPRW